MANFQVYDLFAKCEAGDIRARFTTKKPNSISVVANQDNNDGVLAPAHASNGVDLALVHEGSLSLKELKKVTIDSYFWYIWINRIAGMIYLTIIGAVVYNYMKQKSAAQEKVKEQ